ncbi:hypothetical protein DPM19_05825 [Actinomadura craniellae]|uniref:DUF1795 domain-containing protein n=1 Tax=Actinomadura craniellae TaxID=2231787 RepID=A0A365HDQ8_9ACTN|nr:hypothetical protein [Actinomadura craniellae]RAY16393.1 hypothetical protein DPM19_05825 [Actinomadura craniellae]
MHRHLRAGTGLAAAALLAATGCSDAGERHTQGTQGAGLTTYRGAGFTVGHPRGWRPPARRIFPGANFEVVPPGPAGAPPRASLSVFTERDRRPLHRIVDGLVALGRTSADFRLIERRATEVGDRPAYVVRRGYSAAARDGRRVHLRQVDLLVRLSATAVIDVRVVATADRYEADRPSIDAVLRSFRSGTG